MLHFTVTLFQRIQAFLFTPSPPLWRYCINAWLLAAIPSLILVAAVIAALTLARIDISMMHAPARSLAMPSVIMTAIVAPIIETLILAYMLTLMSSTTLRPGTIAALSGVAWGVFHGLFGLLWFFGTAWGFFVLSCAYLSWRKISFRRAFLAAAIPHAINNSVALIFIAFFHP